VASGPSGRHDGGRLCALTGRVKPALPVLESRERSQTGAARADLVPDLSRSTTAYRDAFKRNLCHTRKRMSSQTPVIRSDPEAQR
jgi:hypothetical protein